MGNGGTCRVLSAAVKSTSHNCLDSSICKLGRNKAAITGRVNRGSNKGPSNYQQCIAGWLFASFKKSAGSKKGDRVALYMPLTPSDDCHACLALDRSTLRYFEDFSANRSPIRRTTRGQNVVTADGGYRRGSEIKLKPAVDEA